MRSGEIKYPSQTTYLSYPLNQFETEMKIKLKSASKSSEELATHSIYVLFSDLTQTQLQCFTFNTQGKRKYYRRRLNGDFGISAVGIICSPGLTHIMGPSSLCDLH